MKLSIYGTTDVGIQREHNEDAFLIIHEAANNWADVRNIETDLSVSRGVVCVVADGMGGANAGEIASEIAISTVRQTISKLTSVPSGPQEAEKMLLSIIHEAHNRIIKAAKHSDSMKGMGTTIIIACLFRDEIYVAWSGDSRCYIYNKSDGKELIPFTDDHSLVWERVKSKEITPEDARLSDDSNLILQSLGGIGQKPDPEFRWTKLNNNDRILLCSDGLNSMLSNIGIQQILDYNSAPKETCESLVQAAKNAGGKDNITAIIIDISGNKKAAVETTGKETASENINVTPSKPKRKRPFLYSIILILLLIIVAGIYFRETVTELFHSAFKAANTTSWDLDIYSHEEGLAARDSNNNTNLGTPVPSINKDQPPEYTLPAEEKQITVDSTYILGEMNSILEKLSSIRNEITWLEPGGKVGASEEFYRKAQPVFDSIKSAIYRQEEMIRSVAMLTNDNRLIRITDYENVNWIIPGVKDTLNQLEKRKEFITDYAGNRK